MIGLLFREPYDAFFIFHGLQEDLDGVPDIHRMGPIGLPEFRQVNLTLRLVTNIYRHGLGPDSDHLADHYLTHLYFLFCHRLIEQCAEIFLFIVRYGQVFLDRHLGSEIFGPGFVLGRSC